MGSSWLCQRPRRGASPDPLNGDRRRRRQQLGPETGPLPGITVLTILKLRLNHHRRGRRRRTERYGLITTVSIIIVAADLVLLRCARAI